MTKKGNRRWNSQDDEFVRKNLGKMSFEDMGEYLERSPMSVRLYVLRRKLTTGQLVKRNLLMALLKIKFRHPEDFSPTRMFYRVSGNVDTGICTLDGNLLQARNILPWQNILA